MAANLEGEEEVKRLAHWLEHTVPLYLTDDDDPCPPGIREQLVKAATILRASSPSGVRIEGWATRRTTLESDGLRVFTVDRAWADQVPATLILHSEVRTP